MEKGFWKASAVRCRGTCGMRGSKIWCLESGGLDLTGRVGTRIWGMFSFGRLVSLLTVNPAYLGVVRANMHVLSLAGMGVH